MMAYLDDFCCSISIAQQMYWRRYGQGRMVGRDVILFSKFRNRIFDSGKNGSNVRHCLTLLYPNRSPSLLRSSGTFVGRVLQSSFSLIWTTDRLRSMMVQSTINAFLTRLSAPPSSTERPQILPLRRFPRRRTTSINAF
jgi:hypothetical protein